MLSTLVSSLASVPHRTSARVRAIHGEDISVDEGKNSSEFL
jgi:hypothetical protein